MVPGPLGAPGAGDSPLTRVCPPTGSGHGLVGPDWHLEVTWTSREVLGKKLITKLFILIFFVSVPITMGLNFMGSGRPSVTDEDSLWLPSHTVCRTQSCSLATLGSPCPHF